MSLKSQFSSTELPVLTIGRDTYFLGIKLDASLNLLAEFKLPFKKISGYVNRGSIKSGFKVCYNSYDTDSDWTELTPVNTPLLLKPDLTLTLLHVN